MGVLDIAPSGRPFFCSTDGSMHGLVLEVLNGKVNTVRKYLQVCTVLRRLVDVRRLAIARISIPMMQLRMRKHFTNLTKLFNCALTRFHRDGTPYSHP